ncbi:hypothetical protein D9M72_586240 [compost metagenome]
MLRSPHQRGMATAIFGNKSAQHVSLWLSFHAQPDQSALPVIISIGTSMAPELIHHSPALHRSHGNTPDRTLVALFHERQHIAHLTPKLTRLCFIKKINYPNRTKQCL